MATVTLDRAWLSLAADPSVAVSFFTTGRGDQRAKPGEVRRYANGRLRTVTRVGSEQTLTLMARSLTPAQVDQLDSWRGTVVLFRDAWGRKMYGTFFTLAVADWPDRQSHDVTLTLQQVSFSEAA
jgi:hypothetical protein